MKSAENHRPLKRVVASFHSELLPTKFTCGATFLKEWASHENISFRGTSIKSTYTKFSQKLTFLTPWYAHLRVRIMGLEMLVFRKILRTYLMDGPQSKLTLRFSQKNYADQPSTAFLWQGLIHTTEEAGLPIHTCRLCFFIKFCYFTKKFHSSDVLKNVCFY